MKAFLESPIGQTIARGGVLAVILAWALWVNDKNTERLFTIIENNTTAMHEVKRACGGVEDGIGRNENKTAY